MHSARHLSGFQVGQNAQHFGTTPAFAREKCDPMYLEGNMSRGAVNGGARDEGVDLRLRNSLLFVVVWVLEVMRQRSGSSFQLTIA